LLGEKHSSLLKDEEKSFMTSTLDRRIELRLRKADLQERILLRRRVGEG